MNKESARGYLPLVQALADGKVIQHHGPHGWYSVAAPSFDSPASDYRIKPEPIGPQELWVTVSEGDPIDVYKSETTAVCSHSWKVVRYVRAD